MFNTLMYAKKLEEAGVSRRQAEAHVQIIAEIVEGELATKSDIRHLEDKLLQLEYRLVIKLGTIVGVTITLALAAMTIILKFF